MVHRANKSEVSTSAEYDRAAAYASALNACLHEIEAAQNIVLTTHINPDGDAIGSELALHLFLTELGKSSVIINPDPTPKNFEFLTGSNEIQVYQTESHTRAIENADAVIILDVNSQRRFAPVSEAIANARARKIVIDHHLDPEPFADVYLVDPNICSTGQIVMHLIQTASPETLNRAIAEALYAAIMTDSGNFRFPRTDSALHRLIAQLLEAGADPTHIYEEIYNQGSFSRAVLLGKALASMQMYHNGRLCIMTVTIDMIEQAGAEDDNTEGFVDHTLAIKGVMMGVLVRETKEAVKLSVRSKNDVPANAVAVFFGGGGHLNAAGARVAGLPLKSVIERLVVEAGKALH